MSFVGLRKPKDRASVIKFLMGYTANPPEVVLDLVVLDLVAQAVEETGEAMGDAMEAAAEEIEESADTP